MAELSSPGAVDAYEKIADKIECFPLLSAAVACDDPCWRANRNWSPTLPPAVIGAHGLGQLHLSCLAGTTAETRQREIVGMGSGGIRDAPQSLDGLWELLR